MLKKYGAVAVLALIATGTHAQQNKTVRVVNGTSSDILHFHASHKSVDGWGRDLLNNEIIASRDSFTFNLDDGSRRCLYDLKAVFSNGREATTFEFDVCARSEWRARP